MITIRQIERLFNAQQWPRLHRELIANRPEAAISMADFPKLPKTSRPIHCVDSLARVIPIAALAMIRMEELSQGYHPFYGRLVNVLLTSQDSEGGWSDPLTTSLCLRAFLVGNGRGGSIHAALNYMANLQKTEGIWPREPLRRMPADASVSAFVLHQLGEFPAFRRAVRFGDALSWFEVHAAELDEPTRRLWSHARLRCGVVAGDRPVPTLWAA